MNPIDILGPTPRRAYRLPLTARLLGWLAPVPRRFVAAKRGAES